LNKTKKQDPDAAKRQVWDYPEHTKRWGSAAAKGRVWDEEYSKGKWDYLDTHNEKPARSGDQIYRYLNKYCLGASVLDLGCGAGTTALEMTDAYREYVGVDVSAVAVERARSNLSQNPQRAGKTFFCASDILSFMPDRQFSTIVFRESLYYFPVEQIKDLMGRYSDYLAPEGAFIIRIHDRRKYQGIVNAIEKHLDLVEKYEMEDSLGVMAVYRPRRVPG
jgi:SAM-dependent methyltransferase